MFLRSLGTTDLLIGTLVQQSAQAVEALDGSSAYHLTGFPEFCLLKQCLTSRRITHAVFSHGWYLQQLFVETCKAIEMQTAEVYLWIELVCEVCTTAYISAPTLAEPRIRIHQHKSCTSENLSTPTTNNANAAGQGSAALEH